MTMRIMMTVISYLTLLLLIMPPSTDGIKIMLVRFVIGLALIVWKKPWIEKKMKSWIALGYAVFLECYFVFCFRNQWMPSSKVRSIAERLHMSNDVLLIIAAVCLAICAFYFVYHVFRQIEDTLKKLAENRLFERNLFCCLIASAATVILAQIMITVDVLSMGIFKFILGSLIVFIVILSFYCLLGEINVSMAVGTGLFLIISTVNVYVYDFRERLFEPVDILSFGTAMNVADNYSLLPVPISIIFGWGVWCGFLACLMRVCLKKRYRISVRKRIILSVFCVIGAVLVFGGTMKLKTYHWHKEGAMYNGYVLDFISKFKEAYVEKPNGYSGENIEKLSVQYSEPVNISESRKPHIIVIMDEAFSDLSVNGEIVTNEEVMPFISSLKEDVISGYTLVSVYGGNTANSEYEFLTGNSMAWMSPNMVPYQRYVKPETYSMVSYLKSQYKYHCVAMHPYLADGWNRPEAYSNMGFDESLFIKDFPQENYIRNYISDREMFEKIVSVYEEQNDKPLFLFGVSMQNHGGYSYDGENYIQSISLVGYDKEYSEVEQYLSLIHETDKAVEYLITYFKEVEDDVVIVFFGDHQPKVEEEFYSEISKNDSASLDVQQTRYKVPFFVWSNYDINEKHVECTSLNYLSSYVYEAADIALPAYNQFLTDMEEKIPALNANGFYSQSSQCYLPFDKAEGEEKSWLEKYEQLQYNNVFDIKNRNETFFSVGE